jgi:hypothetical protein
MTSSQGYDQAPPGRDRVGALAGLASVAAFVAGQYVAPALVWPEEQVGGVQLSFYADDRGRLLAQAILLGVAAALFLRFLAGLRPAAVAAGLDLDPAGPPVFLASSAWVAVLAFATGWPLPSAAGRRAETIG